MTMQMQLPAEQTIAYKIPEEYTRGRAICHLILFINIASFPTSASRHSQRQDPTSCRSSLCWSHWYGIYRNANCGH